MTNGASRLDRIESILATVAEQQAALGQRQDRFQLTLEEMGQQQDQADRNLRESINETVEMIGDLAEQQQATDQRFTNLLEDSRADRQRNETEHQAFRESFQSLLAEIARIWQRLAG